MTRTSRHLAGALGLLLIASSPAAAATAPSAEGCSAAKVVFEGMTDRASATRTVLDEGIDAAQIKSWVGPENYDLAQSNPPVPGEEVEPQRWFAVTATGEVATTQPAPPAAATVQAFLAAELLSASGCEAVRQDAVARGVLLKAPPGARGIDRRTGRYTYRTIRLSVPVLSPDGTEALAYGDSSSAPLGAGGGLWLLRRGPDGAWTVAAQLGLWIS